MKLSSRFIYLIGPEGVGKTTQANLLKRWLESHQFRARIIRIRTGHLFIPLFRKILVKLGLRKKAFPKGGWESTRYVKRLEKIYPLELFLELISTTILAFFRVFLPLALNYVVIAENYVLDTCIDLQRRCRGFKIKKDTTNWILKNLLKLMPNSYTLINLNASYDELKKRYKKRQGGFEPYDYVQYRKRKIFQFASFFEHHNINTEDKTPIETSQEILQKSKD